MRYFLILTLSFLTFVSSYAKRNVSSVYFYTCNLERESVTPNPFSKEFVFQVTDKKEDTTTILRSDRWATAKVALSGSGKLNIQISETHEDADYSKEFKFEIEKFSLDTPNPFKSQFFLKGANEIGYSIDCR